MIFVQSDLIIRKKHSLGKQQRLKSRKIIEQLFTDGQSFAVFPFRLYYTQLNGAASWIQAGFGASSKNVKRAVDRNRVKRLMKEAYRVRNADLQTNLLRKNLHLAIFIIYTGKEVPGHQFVTGKIELILQRLAKIIDEINPSSA